MAMFCRSLQPVEKSARGGGVSDARGENSSDACQDAVTYQHGSMRCRSAPAAGLPRGPRLRRSPLDGSGSLIHWRSSTSRPWRPGPRSVRVRQGLPRSVRLRQGLPARSCPVSGTRKLRQQSVLFLRLVSRYASYYAGIRPQSKNARGRRIKRLSALPHTSCGA